MKVKVTLNVNYQNYDPLIQKTLQECLNLAIARGLLGSNPVTQFGNQIEVQNPVVLKGNKLECPNCKTADHLTHNEMMMCNADIVILESGKWDYSGETEADWNTQQYHPEYGEPEWWCHQCDCEFDAPNCHQDTVEEQIIVKPEPTKPEQHILPGIR
jgi:hypothetical protein